MLSKILLKIIQNTKKQENKTHSQKKINCESPRDDSDVKFNNQGF